MAEFYQTNNNQKPDFNPKMVVSIGLLIVSLILVVVFWKKITVEIPSGNAGVLYRTFGEGTVLDETFGEGFHFIAPWNEMIQYEVREMIRKENMKVLSNDALDISIEMAINYRPKFEKLGYLHSEIGPNYHDRIVINNLRSSARSVFGKYTPEEIYSSKRTLLEEEIFNSINKLVDEKYIDLEQVSIRAIELPQKIKQAIERKLEEEQAAEAYTFKLDRAKREAERLRIEAEGKAAANKILSASLTDKILKEKGIEATLELSQSSNTKVVVVGGDGGLPLILGNN